MAARFRRPVRLDHCRIDLDRDSLTAFFDEGRSRRWAWEDRPAASVLLAAAEDPDRGFDAVVVGEYERAFHGDQFRQVVARLGVVGVHVWLPEAALPGGVG